MKTHTINITTKKGEIQLSRWIITQSHPHPDTHGFSGNIDWRNGGGLFPEYGRPAQGIGHTYRCNLTIPQDEIPDNYNREQFAGFVPYVGYGKPTPPPNPGTLTIRGRDLGEMTIEIKEGHGWPEGYAEISVRGNERPTPQEREIIKREIVPHLIDYIKRNAAELHSEAIKRLTANLAEQVSRVRASADKLEKEAAAAIARLTTPTPTAAAA